MQRHLINDHNHISSCIHRLDARVKIVATVFFIIAVITTPPHHLLSFTLYSGLLLWLIAFAQVPLGFIVSRAALVLPFSLVVALGLPFINGDAMIAVLGLHLSVKGLWILAGTIIKSFLSVTALVLLIATTPFDALLSGLRHLKISPLFLDILALTARYLAVLVDEIHRMRRAATARGYKPAWLAHIKAIGHLIGNLFVRSYERSERIYGAMRLRGYNSRMPVTALSNFRVRDTLGLALAGATLILIRVMAS